MTETFLPPPAGRLQLRVWSVIARSLATGQMLECGRHASSLPEEALCRLAGSIPADGGPWVYDVVALGNATGRTP
mgnify:FL=1